jgi:aminoglycoside adenylyltransferase-like protein
LRRTLGGALLAVYAGGSWSLGGYERGRSDLDVAAIVSRPLADEEKQDVVAGVRHEALPCPARGLELVVYTEAVVRSGTGEPAYELDVNTGADMRFRASLAPSAGDQGDHWYALDRAILRDHGVPLAGPPAAGVIAPIDRSELIRRLVASFEWHAAADDRELDNAVLNACRALRFALDGAWSSKRSAARWALERGFEPDLVRAALRAREGGPSLDRAAVRRFLANAAEILGESER